MGRYMGDCARRVRRGSKWRHAPNEVRSAERYDYPGDFQNGDQGFRVAKNSR